MSCSQRTILFVIHDLNLGGSQSVLSRYLFHLESLGYTTILAVLTSSHNPSFLCPNQTLVIHYLGKTNTSFDSLVSHITFLRSIILRYSPLIVFSLIHRTNCIALLASCLLPVHNIISERNDITRQQLPFSIRLLRILTYPLANTISSNHQPTLSLFNNLPWRKKLYLPNPLPVATSNNPQRLHQLIVVARLVPHKNVHTILEAFSHSKLFLHAWTLLVVGGGPELSNLQSLCNTLGISQYVTFTGPTTKSLDYIAQSSISVLVSEYEGISNFLLESILLHTPIITLQNHFIAKSLLTPGLSCMCPKDLTFTALSQCMSSLAFNPTIRQTLANNAYQALLLKSSYPQALDILSDHLTSI